MWEWLNEALQKFRHCFSNKIAYGWFVIIIIGMMMRSEHVGVSSIVRELSLQPGAYVAIIHFFRAESWYIGRIRSAWLRLVSKLPILYRVTGRAVIVGDGVKGGKEARYMPGVMKLHQESENSSKGEYIFGHMFGGLGVLVGTLSSKLYCVLTSLKLHDGLDAIHGWHETDDYEEESHVVKMIRDAITATQVLGASILLLDRLFLTVPMLTTLVECPILQVVTKAKLNTIAYYDPKPRVGRGAKAKKGEKIKVADLFDTKAIAFETITVTLYEKVQKVPYYSVDLLWGKKLYKKLRFVLTVIDGTRCILVSTDRTLSPMQIIELYCCRFKIECSFRELKQVVAGFAYRFWSKYMPKLNKYEKNEKNQAKLAAITDAKARASIESTVDAIEGHAMFGCIALGLLQILSLLFVDIFSGNTVRFMRTQSRVVPSEATVADFMRKTIYQLFRFFPHLALTCIIKKQQSVPHDPDCVAS